MHTARAKQSPPCGWLYMKTDKTPNILKSYNFSSKSEEYVCEFTTWQGSFSFIIGAAQHKDLASRCFKLKGHCYLVWLGRELQHCNIHWPTTVPWSIMLHGYAWIENMSCWQCRSSSPEFPIQLVTLHLSFHIHISLFPLVSLPGYGLILPTPKNIGSAFPARTKVLRGDVASNRCSS
jgi:hypothetical protein